ncbi:putative disease resistance protein At1g50180 isoform X2 [Humulus lupulus]|uniref:putative disease resistance protein At1g50180 isoform X2 n=1 Tax=Humulus lupulus TaxID=3486 RepID=UPI002B405FAC|nr:putative disease resistance protein At1g50180 isoform X2 [Humulus lupulus]
MRQSWQGKEEEEEEDMAEAVVSFVLERLEDLVLSEAEFLIGIKDQVENAQTKLQCMRAFLKDADACVRNGDERVQLLVVKVRDTSYDLEDVIETYVFKVASEDESGGGIRRVLKRVVRIIDVHKVGSKIRKISSNIDTCTSELLKYGVKESMNKAAETCSRQVQEQREFRRAYSHFVENDVVGFGKDIKELVDHLTVNENPNRHRHRHRVISISGMGGLGKTTLARKVYYHPDLRKHFECFAWVSISQQCDVRDVWEGILFGLTSPTQAKRQEIKSMGASELAKELYNLQKQRKCLVLLDDIWTTSTWDRLKAAFPLDQTCSKILLTTRVKNVALHADRNGLIHELQCLSENESWELFQNKSFCFGNDPTSSQDNEKRKKEIGREMLKYCGGLPLAIIVLGGLLSTKHTVNEWEAVRKNIMAYIRKGRPNDDSKYNSVSWVLGLSYDELPYYLKPCFLYLARYPEDVTIQVKELCLLLIAEGFISLRESSVETVEDMAYDYLSQLVERSMIQVEKWGSIKRLKTFRIHDLMRDLCLSKAKEESFLQFVDLRNKKEEPLDYVLANVRRVAIYFDDDRVDDFYQFIGNTNCSLRCLIVDLGRGDSRKRLVPEFNRFLMLRVLNLDFSFFKPSAFATLPTVKLPKKIGNLIHLRLLSVHNMIVEKIPSSIGNLRCLQTLKLDHIIINDDKLPNVIWKLEQLRHLYMLETYDVAGGEWLRLLNLKNVQTLSGVPTKYLHRDDFWQLKNLKKLCIHVGKSLGKIFHNPPTVKFNSLSSLTVDRDVSDSNVGEIIDIVPMILSCPEIYKLTLWLPMLKLPEFNQLSPNLMKLVLRYTNLTVDPMPTLEKLPNLRFLFFYQKSFKGNEMVCSKGGFPLLDSLLLQGLFVLREWNVEKGALSSLRHLEIVDCSRLRRIPDGIRYVTTLKEIKIENMPMKFKEGVEEGGEEFYKVEHVPSLVFSRIYTD